MPGRTGLRVSGPGTIVTSSRNVADLVALLSRLLGTEDKQPDAQAEAQLMTATGAIQARGGDFVRHCRAHLTLALQDGFVRIRLGYPSTKTEAGRALIELGALAMLEYRPTGKIASKYEITPLGVDLLHQLSEEREIV